MQAAVKKPPKHSHHANYENRSSHWYGIPNQNEAALDRLDYVDLANLMKIANMHTAKTQLSSLVEDALAGEEVIIARRGQPVVRLQAIQQTGTSRKIGSLPSLLKRMPDDFNDSFEDWEETLA